MVLVVLILLWCVLLAVEVQNESLLVSLRALLERVDLIALEVQRMQSGGWVPD